jgi:molybdate transport repressor ModE-like protein
MDHSLEIRHCRILIALSDYGSISAAARALGVAQSTVSETLLSLERLIDTPLTLRRRGQQSTLTAAATTLLPHARALIAAAEAALTTVKPDMTRIIRLGSVESASTFLLPAALAAFRKRWPSIELKVSIGVCDDLRRRVQRGDLDAAITLDSSNEEADDQSRSRVLAMTQLCLFVSRRRAPKKNTISQHDIARHTLLLPDPDGAFNTIMRGWFAKQLERPRIESAGSIDGVKIAVRDSDCVGVLPNYAIAKELTSGEFIRLRLRHPLPDVALGLTLRRPAMKDSPLHDMIEHIERALISSKRAARKTTRIHH